MSRSGTQPIRLGTAATTPRWAWWLLAFAVASLVYGSTANRGVQWQDGGWQQYRIVSRQVDHPLGLALIHPIQHYLGRAAVAVLPVEPAFAITLVSSLAGAIAIANVLLTLLVLTRRRAVACIAATAMMLSHTLWQHATHTESYGIVAALLTGEWLCLALYVTRGKPRYLLFLALLNGLGVANHLLAALATPVDAALILLLTARKTLRGRTALAACGLWILGALPYLVLILTAMIRTGDVIGTIHSALFGEYADDVLNVHLGWRTCLLPLGYILYNFPGFTLPLAVVGLLRWKRAPSLLTGSLAILLLIYLIFAARYSIVDQYSFFFPAYALLTVFSGLGLAGLLNATGRPGTRILLVLTAITAVWTPLVYTVTAKTLASRGTFSSMVGNKPYRDGYQAFFVPWGVGETHATTLNEHALRIVGDAGTILCIGPTIRYALEYEDALGRVPSEVEILQVSETGTPEGVASLTQQLEEQLLAAHPVVLIPMSRDRPSTCLQDAEWTRDGDLYVLARLGSTSAAPPETACE